jgi:hypothetical protein
MPDEVRRHLERLYAHNGEETGRAAVEPVIITLQLGDRYANRGVCELLAHYGDPRAAASKPRHAELLRSGRGCRVGLAQLAVTGLRFGAGWPTIRGHGSTVKMS